MSPSKIERRVVTAVLAVGFAAMVTGVVLIFLGRDTPGLTVFATGLVVDAVVLFAMDRSIRRGIRNREDR